MASFFYCGRLSSAQLHVVPLQALKHWPIISPRPVEQTAFRLEASKTMDYKSVFTNLCLELQQNKSWIKGLGKNQSIHSLAIHSFHSIHSFPDGSAFCPGAPKHVPSDSEKHRRVYTSSNICHSHEWRVMTRLPAKLSKNRMRVYTLSDIRSKTKLRVYTASEAKGLRMVKPPTTCICASS